MKLIVKKESPRKSDSSRQFTLRMDSKLYEDIVFWAGNHRRSVAKEIEEAIYRYVQYCEEEERTFDDS